MCKKDPRIEKILPVLQAGDNTFPENILLNNILLDNDMLVDFF